MATITQSNVLDLARLDGPASQKAEIFQILGDLDQYDLLDEECLVATYVESNVLSEVKDVNGKIVPIYGTDNRAAESRYQGKVFLLIKAGPTAWKYCNNGQPYEGVVPESGDWVVMNASDGRELFLRGMKSGLGKAVSCRRVHWHCIYMRVPDPRVVH